jgi:two-component system response regulator MprA
MTRGEERAGERSRVLVVDDDEAIRTVVGDALNDEGYDVRSARDGAEGLAVLSRWQPDVIVLDLGLPRVGGDELARETRRNDLAPNAATVVLSGEPGASRIATELGASFIPKPFDLNRLLHTIDVLATCRT